MTSISAGSAELSVSRNPLQDPSNPTHASTRMQGGQAVFENDNYCITAGDNDAVSIRNKHTGESYDVSGDPHVNVDGEHAFDFHGTTTLSLEDGTKVTLNTVPSPDNPGTTQTSSVTITNGDYGAQITGVDSGKTGDLNINETRGWGGVLDAVVKDGLVLQENPAGKGFVGVDENGKVHAVDQTFINDGELKTAGRHLSPLQKAFEALSTLISIYVSGQFTDGPRHPGGMHGGRRDHERYLQPPYDAGAGFQPEGRSGGSQASAQDAPGNARAEPSPGVLPDPLRLGSSQNREDHNPVERALDPLGMF